MRIPVIKLYATCFTCCHKHPIEFDPRIGPGNAFSDWYVKHPGHRVEFHWPQRTRKHSKKFKTWMSFIDNADVKVAYASSAAFTITLASLATSATRTAGQESTAVSNTTNKYLDYLVGGKVTTGTTPTTAKQIDLWAYGSVDDTPTYPDVLDGTDSAETITSADILDSALNFLSSVITDSTSNRTYWFKPTSLAAAFGGWIPKNFGLFVAHDTAVNLNSTAGNHALSHTGVYATVA